MKIMEYVEEVSDICGVADFSKDKDDLIKTYGENICIYPYAIVIGHKLIKEIIEKIPETYTNDEYAMEYLMEYTNSFERIVKISEKIEEFIKEHGFNAIALNPRNDTLDLKKVFSNKTSANIAGIGWLGKNNLFTTKEFGPRLTWATILTDAPLGEYTKDRMDSLCGSCTMCVDACPGGAIQDLPDPSKSYDPVKCGNFLNKRKAEGRPMACGMCLYICPYGRK